MLRTLGRVLAVAWWTGGPFAAQAQTPDATVIQPTDPVPEAPRIAILLLSGEEAGVALSDMYATLRDELEAKTRLQVLPLESITRSVRNTAIGECAGDPGCFARRVQVEVQPLDYLLTVSVQQLGDAVLLALRLVDVSAGQPLDGVGGEVPFGMSPLQAAAERLQDVVPAPLWGQVAALSVKSDPEGAQVRVAGLTCLTPCELRRLRPGSYVVEVGAPKFRTASRTVELPAQDRVELDLSLDKDRSLWGSPWLWSAVGAATAAAVTGAVVASQSDPEPRTRVRVTVR